MFIFWKNSHNNSQNSIPVKIKIYVSIDRNLYLISNKKVYNSSNVIILSLRTDLKPNSTNKLSLVLNF